MTVYHILQMYKLFGYGPVSEYLYQKFPSRQFLQVRLWQWFAILILSVPAFLIAYALTKLVEALAQHYKTVE